MDSDAKFELVRSFLHDHVIGKLERIHHIPFGCGGIRTKGGNPRNQNLPKLWGIGNEEQLLGNINKGNAFSGYQWAGVSQAERIQEAWTKNMCPHQCEKLLAAFILCTEQSGLRRGVARSVIKGVTNEKTVAARDLVVHTDGEKFFICRGKEGSGIPADSSFSDGLRVGYGVKI